MDNLITALGSLKRYHAKELANEIYSWHLLRLICYDIGSLSLAVEFSWQQKLGFLIYFSTRRNYSFLEVPYDLPIYRHTWLVFHILRYTCDVSGIC